MHEQKGKEKKITPPLKMYMVSSNKYVHRSCLVINIIVCDTTHKSFFFLNNIYLHTHNGGAYRKFNQVEK